MALLEPAHDGERAVTRHERRQEAEAPEAGLRRGGGSWGRGVVGQEEVEPASREHAAQRQGDDLADLRAVGGVRASHPFSVWVLR